jgi:hypothetical protein
MGKPAPVIPYHTLALVFAGRIVTLRRIFGLEKVKYWEVGVNCINRSFITCTLHHI